MQGKRGTKEMAEEFIGVPKEIIYQLLKNAGSHRKAQEEIFLAHLPEDYQKEYLQVIKGEKLPDLSSDVVAKKIFSPEEHPERLEYLLQQIAKDESIKISHEAMNEGYVQSSVSKKLIFDITAWLIDKRLLNTEFQRAAQEFILERTEIYASDLLLVQYSTKNGYSKSDVDYENVKGILQVILMKHSPKVFDQPEVGDRYIHRFESQTADSGLIYANPLKETIFVQLDKCFAQFVEGKDGENNKELQILLSALYDVNHLAVRKCTKDSDMLKDIIIEVGKMSEDKEVQAMLLAEKYAEADFNAVKSYERKEGIEIGIHKGENTLAETIKRLRNGESPEQIVASGIPQHTVDLAMTIQ